MIVCKNCGHQFEGKYCNRCGQSAKTHRIDGKFLWEDVQHGLLHFDKGIVYTLKQLYLKPGYVIRDYIAGKRVHHFRPISLSIVLATTYALIYHLLNISLIDHSDTDSETLFEHILEHYYWFVFVSIPFFAIGTKISFRDGSYNFWEYFILESFKTAQRLFVHILFLPIIYYFNDLHIARIILYVLMFIDIILIIWTNLQFFKRFKTKEVIWRSLLSYGIYTLLTFILLTILYLSFN